VAIAALVAAFVVVPASGQMHGGGAIRFGGRAGFAPRGPVFVRRGGIVIGSFHSGVRFRTGFGPFFPGRFYRRSIYPYPYSYYGGYAYPLFDSSYSTPDPYAAAAPYMQMSQQLSDQVNRLSDEVERLRDEQQARQTPQASPARQTATAQQPTVLVFHDGHTQEIQNYAIVGRTLWVLSEQRAQKIALTDLDVPATTKANNDRGGDFQVPE